MPTLDEALNEVVANAFNRIGTAGTNFLERDLSRKRRALPPEEEEQSQGVSFDRKFQEVANAYAPTREEIAMAGDSTSSHGIRPDVINEYNRAAVNRFTSGAMPSFQQRQAQFAAESPGRGGTPTRSFSPVSITGKGDPEGGYSVLEGLAKASGSKRIGSILTGVKSGFGAANIQRFRNPGEAVSQSIQDAVWSYGKSPSGRAGVVVPMGSAGAFLVTPSGDTEDIGRGLEDAFRRQSDIQRRQVRKLSRQSSSRRRVRGE